MSVRATILVWFGMAFTALSQTSYAFVNLAGQPGGTGNADGTGIAARFNYPCGVAADGVGNVYVADTDNHTIRRITLAGVVITIAGSAGQSGSADGTNGAARFYAPTGIAVDSAGNLYVADYGNSTIRKITPSGTNWVVTTLAGTALQTGSANGTGSAATFSDPFGVAVDGSGNVYVADTSNHTIRKITPGGVVTTLAGNVGVAGSANGIGTNATFNYPHGVGVDTVDNIYVADTGNGAIRKITPGGDVSIFASTYSFTEFNYLGAIITNCCASYNNPYGVVIDTAGNLYVAETGGGRIIKNGYYNYSVGTSSAGPGAFNQPAGVTVDTAGNAYFTDTGNQSIRKMTPSGLTFILAGSMAHPGSANSTGIAAAFLNPQGVALDAATNVYVADTYNQLIRVITPAGATTTLAGSGSPGSANGTGTNAGFSYPGGIAVDAGSNVYVADTYNNTIREITTGGVVTTLAGSAGQIGSADGTGSAAGFYYPSGVAVDSAYNVYVADTYNHTIRKITAGVVSTLAGSAGYNGSVDGTGGAARFWAPNGVAVDSAANVYVADTFNNTIRQITPAGVVTTLAGSAGQVGGGDGVGTAARFNEPSGVAVDRLGNVYVADTFNQTIRRITPTPASGSTNWVVTTVGGTPGVIGGGLVNGLGGIGPAAEFDFPTGVALDSAGNVYVADTGNNRICMDSILEDSVLGPRFGVPSIAGSLFQVPVINPSPGYAVVIQASTDLHTWVPMLTNAAAVIEVSQPITNQPPRLFFRAYLGRP